MPATVLRQFSSNFERVKTEWNLIFEKFRVFISNENADLDRKRTEEGETSISQPSLKIGEFRLRANKIELPNDRKKTNAANADMAVRKTTNRNLIPSNDSNNNIATDMVFNFSLNVAYDIILKSQQSDVLFPEIEIILIVAYVVLISSGLVSNVLVCFVVTRQCARKKMDLQKSRNLYIVNLAVADLALCCICMPFTLTALVRREWTFGSLLCKLVPVVQGANITVSAGTITAIAFDRYNTIVKSPNSKSPRGGKCPGVVITILLIWLLSFTVTSPLFFYTVIESVTFDNFFLYEKCIERWPSRILHSVFTITLALVQFVIPVLVLTVIHVKISSYLKFHIKPLRKARPEIQIHSPNDPVDEKNGQSRHDDDFDNKSNEDPLKKELLYIRRKESVGSENSQKSCGSSQKLTECSRKNSESSRKNSDSSRNSCEFSPRKRSDFFTPFRDIDFYAFTSSRFSVKSKSARGQKKKEIRRNRRTSFILSCIALVYAVSWLPMTIFQIASTFIPQNDQNPKTIYIIFAFCHILAMSSAVSNPLLYGWLNTNFRKEFLNVFACVSHFYSKLFRKKFVGSSRGKRPRNSLRTQNEIFDQIPQNESVEKSQLFPERKISLNYDNGKPKSSIVLITPLPDSHIDTV